MMWLRNFMNGCDHRFQPVNVRIYCGGVGKWLTPAVLKTACLRRAPYSSTAYAGVSRGNSARFGRQRRNFGQRFGQLATAVTWVGLAFTPFSTLLLLSLILESLMR
jgi:hypothetical protein